MRVAALFIFCLILISGCKQDPSPSENLIRSTKDFFRTYVGGMSFESGPQCRFLSSDLIEERRAQSPEYCRGEIAEPLETPPVRLAVVVSNQTDSSQTDNRAELAIAVCAKAERGWIAQPPFFIQMVRSEGVWKADSFPRPLLRRPSKIQLLAGQRAMLEILENPFCRDPSLWGSDQWFSYKKVSAEYENTR